MPKTRAVTLHRLTRQLDGVSAERRSAAIRVAAALGIAAALTVLAIVAAWGPFENRTDIVGFPAFDAFNVQNYLNAYYLVVGFFPLAALGIFLGLTRLAPRLGLASPPARGPIRPQAPAPDPSSPLVAEPPAEQLGEPARRAVRAARLGFVGALFGIEAGIAADSIWAGLLLGVCGYALLAWLAAAALGRSGLREWPLEARLAAVNAMAAPLAVAGLLAVAAATGVQVKDDGQTVHYHWLPIWLAVPLAAALLAAVAVALRRAGSARRVAAVERTVLVLIAAPLTLFLLSATLQGDALGIYGNSPTDDLFHSGEQLTASRLVSGGWFPWRDLVLTHGLLSDALAPLVGHAAFGDSRWGNIAGLTVFLHPLYLVCVYFLCTYLFGRNWLFLLLIALLALATSLGPELRWLAGENFRFVLWPLVLLVLAATLNRPTKARAVGLAFLAVGQAIVTPEAMPALFAVAVVLVAYEWYWRGPELPLSLAYRRSLWFGGAAIAFAAAFAAYLAVEGALGDFLYLSGALVQGHVLKGGIPPATFELSGPQYYFVALAPPAALLISLAYAVSRVRLRKPPRTEDWVVGGMAIFLLFYYPKFIARMDIVHLYQPYSIALPLLLYILYRGATAAEAMIRARAPGSLTARVSAHPVSLLLVALVVAFAPGHIYDRVDRAAADYRPEIESHPQIARLGFQTQVDVPMYRDLGRVVDAYLGRGDRLLDFTNEPALFYYVLDRDPATRWFDAALTLTSDTQQDQISLLRRDPPKLVVFDSNLAIGLSNWDGIPTAVRDYEVSRWILEHYRPLLTSHSHTFYLRRGEPARNPQRLGLEEAPITHRIEFQAQRCNWGKAPNFLSGPGTAPPGAAVVDARLSGAGGSLTIEPPSGRRWSDYRWLELDARRAGFGAGDLSLQDRVGSGINPGHQISFETTEGSPRRYIVPVGSCAQWFGYGRAALRLDSDPAQDIGAVRLIR